MCLCELPLVDLLVRFANNNLTDKQQKSNTLPVMKQAPFRTDPLQKIKSRKSIREK
jgi:hypothetical protein